MIRSFADPATADLFNGVESVRARRACPSTLWSVLARMRPPTHPGEMLLEEFLKPLGISQSAFAIQLGVSLPRLNEVVNAKRAVTPDTALRLAQVTGMTAVFWLGLQQDWDLWHAVRSAEAVKIGRLTRLPRAG